MYLFIFVKPRHLPSSEGSVINCVTANQPDINLFCFRDVAAAMAHRPETAAGIYDVYGDYHASTRLRGHATLLRQRQQLAFSAPEDDNLDDPDSSADEAGSGAADSGATDAVSVAAYSGATDAVSVATDAVSVATDAVSGATDADSGAAAADSGAADADSGAAHANSGAAEADSTVSPGGARAVARRAAAGGQAAADVGRLAWTAAETQVVTAAMRDFITGKKTRYDVRDLSSSDRQALARFSTKQLYDKCKYLKKRFKLQK